MVNTSFPDAVLAVMLTDFCCIPGFPLLSKETFIFPVLPGLIGSLGNSGTVQPHDPDAFAMIKSASPVLVKVKVVSTLAPSLITPKSCSFLLNVITGYLPSDGGVATVASG